MARKLYYVLIVVVIVVIVLALALGLGLGLGLRKHHHRQCTSDVFVYFASPQVLLQGYSIPVTIFVSGLALVPDSISIENTASGNMISLPQNNTDLNELLVYIPSTTPAGTYNVLVSPDGKSCPGRLTDGLIIRDPNDASNIFLVTAVNPSFVYNASYSPISITVASTTTLVEPVNAVLVGPTTNGSAVLPYQLLAVVHSSTTGLSAVVPPGLPLGKYTLIVTNGDNRLGFLADAVTVTNNALPEIISVIPKTTVASGSGTSTTLTVIGVNFSGPGTTVKISCSDTITAPVVTTLAVTFASYTTLVTTLPTLTASNLCDVIVTNIDGASVAYWAIGTLSGSQNLPFLFNPVSAMASGRRGLSLSELRPTLSASYLFAIGGDSGSVSSPLATTEVAALGRTGSLSAWTTGRPLPGALTLHSAAVIGKYIYVIGGFSGSGAQSNVWRAQILDPLAVPTVTANVSAGVFANSSDSIFEQPNGGKSFARWYYFVSAHFNSSYLRNPGGESLPSDVTVVQVPIITEGGVAVGLSWDAIPGADYYRVYRSTAADSITSIGFLSNVYNATSYIDYGYPTTPGTPLAVGSVGVWHSVVSLNTARGGHQSPVVSTGTANQYFLYAMGGNNGATFFNSVEYITVTIVPPLSNKDTETQTLSLAWTTDVTAMPSVRSDFKAYALIDTVDLDFAGVPANQTAVFITPGRTAASSYISTPHTALVSATGALTGWLSLKTPNTQDVSLLNPAYGYSCVSVASQFSFLIGGAKSPSAGTSWNLQSNTTTTFNRDFVSANPNSLGSLSGLPGGVTVMGDCVVTHGNIYIAGGNSDGYGGSAPSSGVSAAGF